jgi:branched-chain amino acid transport system substrate-binding protein
MTRGVIGGLLVGSMVVAGSVAFGGAAAAGTPKASSTGTTGEVVIGIVNDTSGPSAAFSTVTQEGLLLAVDEINKSGGFAGKKIRLVQDSDGGDATQTSALVRKQAGQGAVAILLTTGSASALGVKPVCIELKIVCMHPTSPSTALSTAPNNAAMFTVAPGVDQVAAALGGAMNKTGVKKLAVLEDNSPTIKGVNDALIPALQKYGLQVVAREAVPVGATDASAEVARVKASNPDAVLMSDLGGQTEITMINALHQQMPDTPKFGKLTISDQPDTWKLADPGALNGVVYAQTIDSKNPRTIQLQQKLKKKLGSKFLAMSDYYAWGYDGVNLLRTAAENTAAPDLASALEQVGGYKPHFGQEPLTLSYTPAKHSSTDNLCAMSFLEFGKNNKPKKLPWSEYQPPC